MRLHVCIGKWHLGDHQQYWPTAHWFDVNLGGCGLGGPPTYFDPFRIPTLPTPTFHRTTFHRTALHWAAHR
jgi:hypothetical protein